MVFSYEYSTGPSALPGIPCGLEWANPLARQEEFYARMRPGGRLVERPPARLVICPTRQQQSYQLH
jgi:hypothetical protein